MGPRKGGGPKGGGPEGWGGGGGKISRFFSISRRKIRSSLPSLGGHPPWCVQCIATHNSAANRDGAVLEAARRRKERRHPELVLGSRARLVVLAEGAGLPKPGHCGPNLPRQSLVRKHLSFKNVLSKFGGCARQVFSSATAKVVATSLLEVVGGRVKADFGQTDFGQFLLVVCCCCHVVLSCCGCGFGLRWTAFRRTALRRTAQWNPKMCASGVLGLSCETPAAPPDRVGARTRQSERGHPSGHQPSGPQPSG